MKGVEIYIYTRDLKKVESHILTDIFDTCKEPKIVGFRLLSSDQLSAF